MGLSILLTGCSRRGTLASPAEPAELFSTIRPTLMPLVVLSRLFMVSCRSDMRVAMQSPFEFFLVHEVIEPESSRMNSTLGLIPSPGSVPKKISVSSATLKALCSISAPARLKAQVRRRKLNGVMAFFLVALRAAVVAAFIV